MRSVSRCNSRATSWMRRGGTFCGVALLSGIVPIMGKLICLCWQFIKSKTAHSAVGLQELPEDQSLLESDLPLRQQSWGRGPGRGGVLDELPRSLATRFVLVHTTLICPAGTLTRSRPLTRPLRAFALGKFLSSHLKRLTSPASAFAPKLRPDRPAGEGHPPRRAAGRGKCNSQAGRMFSTRPFRGLAGHCSGLGVPSRHFARRFR